MYKIKKPGIIQFLYGDNKRISKKIGIDNAVLSRILNGKQTTSYETAYIIVKLYNSEKEVSDYFIQNV